MNKRKSIEEIKNGLEERYLLETARMVAGLHHVTLDAMVSRSHGAPESAARHELWWRLHRSARLGLAALGRIFDRDHTTIRSGIAAHERRRLAAGKWVFLAVPAPCAAAPTADEVASGALLRRVGT